MADSAEWSGGYPNLERQHGCGVVVEALSQFLIGPILGLASSGCPNTPNVMSGIAQHVPHIIPVVHTVGEHLPLLERQLLGHFAVLHFPSWVVVTDALLRVAVEDYADVLTAVGHDHARLAVGDDAPAYLSWYAVMASDVVAVVVAHGFLHACAALAGVA